MQFLSWGTFIRNSKFLNVEFRTWMRIFFYDRNESEMKLEIQCSRILKRISQKPQEAPKNFQWCEINRKIDQTIIDMKEMRLLSSITYWNRLLWLVPSGGTVQLDVTAVRRRYFVLTPWIVVLSLKCFQREMSPRALFPYRLLFDF